MADQKPTTGYQARLRQALAAAGMSVRTLGGKLETDYRGVRGATYSAIRQYSAAVRKSARTGKTLSGVQNPRIELLQAVAAILGVRWEWLAYDEGARTRDEQALREGVDREAPDSRTENDPDVLKLRAAYIGMWDGLPGQESLYWLARSAVEHSWIEAWASQPYPDVEAAADSAKAFVRMVFAPLRDHQASIAEMSTDRQLQYVFGMCQTVSLMRDKVLPPPIDSADYYKTHPLPNVLPNVPPPVDWQGNEQQDQYGGDLPKQSEATARKRSAKRSRKASGK